MYPRAGHQPLAHATTTKEEKEVLNPQVTARNIALHSFIPYRVKFKESYQFVSNQAFSV